MESHLEIYHRRCAWRDDNLSRCVEIDCAVAVVIGIFYVPSLHREPDPERIYNRKITTIINRKKIKDGRDTRLSLACSTVFAATAAAASVVAISLFLLLAVKLIATLLSFSFLPLLLNCIAAAAAECSGAATFRTTLQCFGERLHRYHFLPPRSVAVVARTKHPLLSPLLWDLRWRRRGAVTTDCDGDSKCNIGSSPATTTTTKLNK
jgi:hypothetical protein